LGGGEMDMMLLAHGGTPWGIIGTRSHPRMASPFRQPHPVTALSPQAKNLDAQELMRR
jgi:hypothetical protein